uniref:ubiquitin carboxyl-terminal hydrolase 17-like protein 6 n=1 Tax=Callospermophilus lateralis TaxID=76772 RepID=UPI00403876B4
MTCRVSRAEEAMMQEQVAPGSQDLSSYGLYSKATLEEHKHAYCQFRVVIKPHTQEQSGWIRIAGTGPARESSLSPCPDAPLKKNSAPVGPLLAPRGKLCLNWQRPSTAGAGLQNMGNTCYVNAALQCLTYTAPLANYMLSQEHCQRCPRHRVCMLCVMQAHVTRALRHPGDVIQPLPALVDGFHTSRQEDAHEFLLFTLHAMQKACLCGHKQPGAHPKDPTLMRQIFGGCWRSQIKCLHCCGLSDTFDPYLDIMLDITAAPSVQHALEHLVKPEWLEGENAYQCGVCQKKRPACKTLTLQKAPKVLMLVLKRFSDLTGEKIAKHVQYPECLDMQPYMSQQGRGPLVYALYAVLVHAGVSCHSGHYYCYIKAGNGHWYKMDDAKVVACDIACVLSQRAYVLFYVQKSDLETDNGSVSLGRETIAHGPGDTILGVTQGELQGDSYCKALEPEEHLVDTANGEITLDQWKFLQQQNRPKSEFNLRKVEFTLPPNVVVIHQSKHREKENINDKQEKYKQSKDTKYRVGEELVNTAQLPCLTGRPRATKKKNKQGKRTVIVV